MSNQDLEPTIASLPRITREDLSEILTNSSSPTIPSNIAIIDVRDSDHIGGHIRGSTWVPSSELDFKTPELVRQLKDKETVVFHCALSQVRGPKAALGYLRERRRLGGGKKGKKEQRVVVLEGGFTKWQEKYGEDKRLTEGYQKDIWEFGY
ncbi:Rhodanese-like protein [Delitschia confertaspora ATCC 74209]|uniref:Rhodanese-like protein n=1 Tax=Delitschia confertaspora ATCC 74209 TaxID=1513339 RepID=A0A9P4JLJ1_9PLEO|nr:Rhodanese-like protein [Delitschia confertaspora ATCC 74209]